MDEGLGLTLSERDEDILVRFIGAIDEGLPQVSLMTREGWAIAACAVTTAGTLGRAWLDGKAVEHDGGTVLGAARERVLRTGISLAADVYSQMSASLSGRMPGQSASMGALIENPQGAVAKIATRSVQLRALGEYDATAAIAKLSQIMPPELTLEIMDGTTPALLGLRGTLAQVCPGAGFEVTQDEQARAEQVTAVPPHADEKVPDAPASGAGKSVHEKGSRIMDENTTARTETAKAEPIYAHVKVSPTDVKLTGKTSETKSGKTMHHAFFNLPRGTNVNDVDLTGYQIFTKLADFQRDKLAKGEPITLRFNEKYPVEVFRGFDEAGQRIDPMKVDPWKFCSAVKAATAARDANRENYVRINVAREDVHPYTKMNAETGERTDMARVTLPEGTFAPSGEDISGRNVFLRMSKFNAKDLEAGRDNISFSVFKDSHITAFAEKDSGEAGVSVGGADLSRAVAGAREAARANEGAVEAPEGSLAELEGAVRAGVSYSADEMARRDADFRLGINESTLMTAVPEDDAR